MNVDRPALLALVLFGLLGIGFAVTGLSLFRPAKSSPKKAEPELLPMPRVLGEARLSQSLFVSVAAPGLSVEEVERLVAQPLEHSLMPLKGRVGLRTCIEEGRCRITISLSPDRDLHQARTELLEAIKGAQAHLPESINAPRLDTHHPDALPLIRIAATSDGQYVPLELSNFMRDRVRPALQTIPGISAVELQGDVERLARVEISPDKLLARGLTVNDVADALRKADLTPGSKSPEDLERLVVSVRNDVPIYVRDIAGIVDMTTPAATSLLDGKRAVFAGVFFMQGSDAKKIARAVGEQLKGIKLPDGMSLEIVADATEPTVGDLCLEVRTLPGESPEFIEKMATRLEAAIRERLPRTEVGSIIALASDSEVHSSNVQLFIALAAARTMSVEAIQKRIREAVVEMPGTAIRFATIRGENHSRRLEYPVKVRIVGDDLEKLALWNAAIASRGREASSGLYDVSSESFASQPQMRIIPDRDRAARFGVSIKDISQALEATSSSRYMKPIHWRVALTFGQKQGKTDWSEIPIRVNEEKVVLMKDVTKLEQTAAPEVLLRFDGQRGSEITANPASGVSIEQARDKLRSIADEARQRLNLPATYRIID